VQTSAPLLVDSTPSVQFEQLLEPSSSFAVLAEQASHREAPTAAENRPTGHLEHTLEPTEAAYRPTGQLEHAVAPMAPDRTLVAPTPHLEQIVAPVALEKVPSWHGVQSAWPDCD
jgi:hypothetical protein